MVVAAILRLVVTLQVLHFSSLGMGSVMDDISCMPGIEDISNITLPSCASCENKCGNTSDLYQNRACSCDSICVLNRDCCPDFEVKCPVDYEVSESFYIQEEPSCVSTNWPQVENGNNYLLVSKCKMNQTKCHVSNHTPNMLIPVYNKESKQHFVNTNCAVCNGMCDIVPWNTEVTCPDIEEASDVNKGASNVTKVWEKIQKGVCNIKTYPTENMVKPRKCIKDTKRSCPQRCVNSSIEYDCLHSNLVYIEGNKTTYANLACKYCNEWLQNETKCKQNSLIKETRVKRSVEKYSFHMLFDVDPRKGVVIGDEAIECSSEDYCVVYNEDACTLYAPPFYDVTFEFNVTKKYQNVTSAFIDKVRRDLSKNLSSAFPHSGIFIQVINSNLWSVRIQFLWETVFNETLLETVILEYFTLLFEDNSIMIMDKNTQVSKNLDCVIHKYTEKEYDVEDNKTITIKENGRQVGSDQFFIKGKLAFVCIEEWMNVRYPKAFGIVTIICTSISILALVSRLLFHCIIRNTTDQSTNKFRISLTVALLSAMVSFILHPLVEEIPKLCYVVSVWIHWSFLTAFSWMTAIAVDITRMLRATQKLRQVENTPKIFLVYSIIAWGIPTLIVTFAIGLDFTRISWYWRPHYGETVCWISSRYALLAYFITPVAAAIAINISMFITSSVLLFKLQAGSTCTDEHGLKARLILHVKLLALMGLTWIFGFLAAPLRSDTLWYIFIILNASQGVFVLLIFIFSSQFRKYIKEAKKKINTSYRLTGQTAETSL